MEHFADEEQGLLQAPGDLFRPLFQTFFSAGFECSTHCRPCGHRLDLVAGTEHDRHCLTDYAGLVEMGIRTCREGIRWHLIETGPARYDFSSVQPMVDAAHETGMQVIWDIFHFGYPDDLDPFTPAFVSRLAGLAKAFTKYLYQQGFEEPYIVPVNEPSFMSWGGGDVACINPYERERGFELKVQMTLAHLASMNAIREINPSVRLFAVDPVIHISNDPERPQDEDDCRRYSLSMYQAWDLLEGRLWPCLGGYEGAIDIIGVNFYAHNQWVHEPYRVLEPGDPLHRPLREILNDVFERYNRPIFISETGAEDEKRGPWLRYVCDEVQAAIEMGLPIHGICLYPIINHLGWENDRHCRNGLWDFPVRDGAREIEEELARELREQIVRMESLYQSTVCNADC